MSGSRPTDLPVIYSRKPEEEAEWRRQKQCVTHWPVRESVSHTVDHWVRQRWACDHCSPFCKCTYSIYLRGEECSVRTRLVSIPLSSPLLLGTRVIEEAREKKERQTEIEAGVRRGKGQKSERGESAKVYAPGKHADVSCERVRLSKNDQRTQRKRTKREKGAWW